MSTCAICADYKAGCSRRSSISSALRRWGPARRRSESSGVARGKWDEAISKYREALRIRPNYPLATANLDTALSEMSKAPAR